MLAYVSRVGQDRVDRYFRREAAFWDEIYVGSDVYALIHQQRRERALRWIDGLGLPRGARVLEVGCGAGHTAIALARRGFDVDATDAVDAMVELAQARVSEAEPELQLRVSRADAQQLPFDDGTFDAALALGVIPWLPDPPAALRELARVVRPGGCVVLNADNRSRLTHLLDPARNPKLVPLQEAIRRARGRGESSDPGTTLHSRREFGRLLAAAGLTVERSETLGFGQFTLLGRRVVPARAGVRLHRGLQQLADRGVPVVRATGAQYLVLARRA